MSSIYFQLALLALIFACFGFLLHAFYFGDSRQKRLSKEIGDLEKELEQKGRELLQAEEGTQKADKVILSLEKQLQQKAVEMEHLKQLAARQDKAIEMLQKDAEVIRAAVSGSAKSVKSVQQALAAVDPFPPPPPAEAPPAPPIKFRERERHPPAEMPPAPPVNIREREQHAPAEMPPAATIPAPSETPTWKENLDNILSILDTMEKEVDK